MDVRFTATHRVEDSVEITLFTVRKLRIILCVLMVFVGFGIMTLDQMGSSGVVVVVGLLTGAALWFCTKIAITRQTQKQFHTNALSGESVEFVLNEDGMTNIHSMGQATVPFHKFYKVVERPGAFYLYQSSRQILSLQKRNFASEQDIDTARRLFTEHMPGEKVKLLKQR